MRPAWPHPIRERPFVFSVERMNIMVNGKAMEVPDGLSVDGLLDHLGVLRKYTAVALNREVTSKSTYASTFLRDGDRVEIVRPMGGG